jgi:hypothetical protein
VKNDFAYVAILVGFFVVSILFVRVCEWIIGPDDAALSQDLVGGPQAEHAPDEVPA